MKQILQFAAGAKSVVIAAEVDEDSRAFTAMRRLFALRNASHPVIARMHHNDPQFWRDVVRFRQHQAAKAKEKEQNDDA
jgi:hypothetical protein